MDGSSSVADESALENNIRTKGKNSYYYAHKKNTNASEEHQWDGQEQPRLLETTEAPTTLPQTLYTPITKYSWSDGKKKVGIYFTLSGIGALEEEQIQLKWTETSLEMFVHFEDNNNLVFKIPALYESIAKVVIQKRQEDRLVLSLVKSKEFTWHALKKDN